MYSRSSRFLPLKRFNTHVLFEKAAMLGKPFFIVSRVYISIYQK